jgi:integrase
MVKETTVRKGFLTDKQYADLRDALLQELKSLFVCGYITGIRKGELTDIQWPQLDFESDTIALEPDETKNREGRSLRGERLIVSNVPILKGDMRDLLLASKKERDELWPDSPWVFNREGKKIIDFRVSWENACKAAGVPELDARLTSEPFSSVLSTQTFCAGVTLVRYIGTE